MWSATSCLGKVGRPFQSDGEGVELRPPCLLPSAGLDAPGSILLGDCRDDGAVESARQQHPVGNVAHQLALYGGFQGVMQFVHRRRVVFHGVIVRPFAFVPAGHLAFAAPVVVPRRERFVALALPFERLQLAGTVDGAVGVIADVEGNHANGVACDEELVALLVVEGEGEDAVQLFQEVHAPLTVEGQDDFAVAPRPEAVVELLPQRAVVVDFPVDGEDLPAVSREEGLSAALRVDDGETFVCQDGRASAVDAAPVGAAVTDALGHVQGFAP